MNMKETGSQTRETGMTNTTFETETCGRCGGSGKFSYCPMYGDRCFKCCGAKAVLTKRGAAAQKYFTELCSKPARELVAGDRIQTSRGWETVQEVAPYDNTGAWSSVNGVRTPGRTDLLQIQTELCLFLGVAPEKLERVAQGKEEKAAKLALAMEYQASLTKTGTPRKVKAAV
jgi:hypothetical protein